LNFTSQISDLEPYLVLRGHTGPLFSLATSPDNSNLIYTAGNEGIIKIWKVPKSEEVTQYGDTDCIFNCNVGFYQIQNEVIWDIKHHPKQVNIFYLLKKLLVSLSTDACLNIWETGTAEEHLNALAGNLKLKKRNAI
jgi:striatin 1/3/4